MARRVEVTFFTCVPTGVWFFVRTIIIVRHPFSYLPLSSCKSYAMSSVLSESISLTKNMQDCPIVDYKVVDLDEGRYRRQVRIMQYGYDNL